jgi:methylmalonyl-CoA mutase C-terminal domain/subunit
MEVIYTGLRSTPELIVATAVQESCDVIGLSVLSGAHETIARRTIELLRARNAHIPILIGGVIPPEDRERLKQIGIAAIYGQEATLEEIVAGVKALARAEEDKR